MAVGNLLLFLIQSQNITSVSFLRSVDVICAHDSADLRCSDQRVNIYGIRKRKKVSTQSVGILTCHSLENDKTRLISVQTKVEKSFNIQERDFRFFFSSSHSRLANVDFVQKIFPSVEVYFKFRLWDLDISAAFRVFELSENPSTVVLNLYPTAIENSFFREQKVVFQVFSLF